MDQLETKRILGNCLQMCPKRETELRISNNMVHCLERPGTERKYDPNMLIKSFARSAAGNTSTCDPCEIRPPHICRRTVNYLVQNILLAEQNKSRGGGFMPPPPPIIMDEMKYQFVFDRLRAIRQDMVVQRVGVTGGGQDGIRIILIHIHILQVCVKFHLFANYSFTNHNYLLTEEGERHASNTTAGFDSQLNFSHLLECVKMVLVLYQELELIRNREELCDIFSKMDIDKDLCDQLQQHRCEMIGTYLLLNLGSSHSYTWGLGLCRTLKDNGAVAQALKINRLYMERNFAGLFKNVRKLSLIYLLAFQWNLPFVMKDSLTVMNIAYSSKMCKYPVSSFAGVHAIETVDAEEILRFCEQHSIEVVRPLPVYQGTKQSSGITIESGNSICFLRSSFNSESKCKWRRLPIIDDTLQTENLKLFFLDFNECL